jgi:hypothetical protein
MSGITLSDKRSKSSNYGCSVVDGKYHPVVSSPPNFVTSSHSSWSGSFVPVFLGVANKVAGKNNEATSRREENMVFLVFKSLFYHVYTMRGLTNVKVHVRLKAKSSEFLSWDDLARELYS